MVHVIATIDLHPGTRAAFLKEFRAVMPLVHAERGCIEYTPVVDMATQVPLQSVRRENAVVVVEKWETLSSLETHLRAPHMGEFREKVHDMVVSVNLQILEPA